MSEKNEAPDRVTLYLNYEEHQNLPAVWESRRSHGYKGRTASYVREDLVKAKDERIAELEADRNAQKKCADAYFNALADIRGSLGLSEHDEHEFVTDSIKRLVSRLVSVEAELLPTVEALERANAACDTSTDRIMDLVAERDKYQARAISLFWRGDADDVSAGKLREAAAKIEAAIKDMNANGGPPPVVEEHRHNWTEREGDTQNLYCECGEISRPLSPDVEGHWPCMGCDALIPEQGYCESCIEDMRKRIDEPVVEKRRPLPVCMMPDGGQCCNYHRTGGDWRAECGGEDLDIGRAER